MSDWWSGLPASLNKESVAEKLFKSFLNLESVSTTSLSTTGFHGSISNKGRHYGQQSLRSSLATSWYLVQYQDDQHHKRPHDQHHQQPSGQFFKAKIRYNLQYEYVIRTYVVNTKIPIDISMNHMYLHDKYNNLNGYSSGKKDTSPYNISPM